MLWLLPDAVVEILLSELHCDISRFFFARVCHQVVGPNEDPHRLSMASDVFEPPAFQVWVLDGCSGCPGCGSVDGGGWTGDDSWLDMMLWKKRNRKRSLRYLLLFLDLFTKLGNF